jgi:hypothetical protein
VVIPEWEYLDPKFKDDLVNYVKNGGNLLLTGPGSAALFAEELKVQFDPSPGPGQLQHAGALEATKGAVSAVTLSAGVQPFGKLQAAGDAAAASQPAAAIASLGKGKIAATHFNLGQTYNGVRGETTRAFTGNLVQQLFPAPMVTVQGSPFVDVALARKDGKLLVNLVNAAGPHQTEPTFDSIPAVGPLEIALRLPKKPKSITLQPLGLKLKVNYAAGLARVTLPSLAVHDILVVE